MELVTKMLEKMFAFVHQDSLASLVKLRLMIVYHPPVYMEETVLINRIITHVIVRKHFTMDPIVNHVCLDE